MFDKILAIFASETPEAFDPEDARVAMAGLLVRIAKSDGQYDAEELAHIDRVLAKRYNLNPVEAAKLRVVGEDFEAQAPDTVRFTSTIKQAVPYEDREGVVEALWDIVLADGTRSIEEDAILRTASKFLGVNDRDSHLARQRVEAAQKT
ncbi:TerB family tellurite resistance protein [Algirhabdus cladophorae]|uniref:tellurite resistance TerB family protein n=1 Tax=Algirhabdus cladophorae TaxID=3377108 RepID=UPI003B848CB7